MDEATDTCPRCGETKPIKDFGRDRRRPEACLWDCIDCQNIYRAAREQRYRDRAKARAAARRDAVLDHYGRRCACCGTAERLVIDHVNGDGEAHRAEIGATKLYEWLIANGFPEGFQTLCSPCNGSKRSGPWCKMHRGETA